MCDLIDMIEPEKMYKCSYCDHTAKINNNMASHVKSMHKNKIIEHTCEFCRRFYAAIKNK